MSPQTQTEASAGRAMVAQADMLVATSAAAAQLELPANQNEALC